MKYFHFRTVKRWGCGLFVVTIGKVVFHLFPKGSMNQFWGLQEDWYDGPLYSFGLGKFMLICW